MKPTIKTKLKPKNDDEWIVLLWQRGQTCRDIGGQIGWSPAGVRTRVSQLRALGVPLVRTSVRYDLDVLEVELDLVRLKQIAVEAKREVSR